jgi:hypothetical protein
MQLSAASTNKQLAVFKGQTLLLFLPIVATS